MTEKSASDSHFVSGIIRVSIASIIWGAAYPLTKGALNQIPPIILGFSRFFVAALGMTIITASFPLKDIEAKDRWRMAILAFWGAFVLVISVNYGLKWAPAVVASIISGTPPLFTVVLAVFWLGERVDGRKIWAIVIAFCGIFLISGVGLRTDGGWLPIIGSILVIIPQISWAIYGVLGKLIISKYSWKQVCRDTFAIGALMLAPFAVIEGFISGIGNWNYSSLSVLFYLGVFNSMVTYGLWNRALKDIPVSTASIVLYLQPVSGAILSEILFHETLGATGWLGSGLIFLGIWLVLGGVPQSLPKSLP